MLDGEGRPVIEQSGSGTTPPSTLTTAGYQIYSSVLDKVVVNLNSSGGQSSTNIYAGAAQIATLGGLSSTGTVIMKSADPVTGTMTNYSYSSYGTFANVEEEDEPLGQKIEPDDPFTDADTGPETYSEIDNSPRFPEWQCEVADLRGDGFWDQPAFCQQAMLQRLSDAEFRDKMGWNSFADPENINDDNPRGMPPHEGDPGGSAQAHGDPVSSAVLADALTSSSKPNGPSDSDGCTYGTDGGQNNCWVQSQPANDPFADLDASQGGPSPDPGPTPTKRISVSGAIAAHVGGDPCPNKGQLDFYGGPELGIAHIQPRHIDQLTKWKQKSRYRFQGYMDPNDVDAKQNEVMRIDQLTFETGVAFPQRDGRVRYIAALSYPILGKIIPPNHLLYNIGIDNTTNSKTGIPASDTNVNTVVVDADCKTVITSFPGLPSDVSFADPRIPANATWFPPGWGVTRRHP